MPFKNVHEDGLNHIPNNFDNGNYLACMCSVEVRNGKTTSYSCRLLLLLKNCRAKVIVKIHLAVTKVEMIESRIAGHFLARV